MTSATRPSRDLSCRKVGRLLQRYLDGELGDARAVVIADHLDACLRCGLEATTYRWLKEQLAAMGRADDPRLLSRLQAFVDELASSDA